MLTAFSPGTETRLALDDQEASLDNADRLPYTPSVEAL